MTEDEAATELLRRQALADAAEARAQLEADRPAREARADAAMVERWRARHEQTPRPVRRAAEPAQRREMAPPMPDKLHVPRHDPATGRIVGISVYENSMSIKNALGWEDWVHTAIKASLDRRLKEFSVEFAGLIGGEVYKDIDAERDRAAGLLAAESVQLRTLIERQAAQIEQMARRIEQLEARAAPPPRLVDDAAD